MPPAGQPITLIDKSGVTRYVGTFQGLPFVVGPASFAFDDPGLTDGIPFYVPTDGGILLDAWIEVQTGWNGTTPKADIGQFTAPGQVGYFGSLGRPVNVHFADADNPAGLLRQSAGGTVASSLAAWSAARSLRLVPARWTSAEPLKVVVSQDGLSGGAAPGATQGEGAVFMVVATSGVQL